MGDAAAKAFAGGRLSAHSCSAAIQRYRLREPGRRTGVVERLRQSIVVHRESAR